MKRVLLMCLLGACSAGPGMMGDDVPGDDAGTGDGGGSGSSCTSAGVSAQSQSVALPPGYSEFYGIATSGAYCDNRNVPEHVVMDLTGDGKPDMVVTSRCNDTDTDRTHWLVYAGTGTGFAPTATTFALPPGYTQFYGISTQGAYCDSRNVPGHVVMDMTGDGKPDLLVTQRCNDSTVDRDQWLLHVNTGTGFAATPTSFALPPGYTAFYGLSTAGSYCDNRNVPGHVVMDLTGDGKPDLLVTARCNDTAVDRAHWLLYTGSATGFAATPSMFALPAGYSAFYGTATAGAYCDSRNVPGHVVMDLTGDARPDLVVTERCNDAEVGKTQWLVYQNAATGFSGTPLTFALPPGYSQFYGVASAGAYCDNRNVPGHMVFDMGGDKLPDMLVTDRCNDTTIDRDHWLVYENTGTGFATASTNFALPTEYSEYYGVSTAGAYCDNRNVPGHSMLDLGGDGRPDLLVTDRCNDTTIDRDHWLVYENRCM